MDKKKRAIKWPADLFRERSGCAPRYGATTKEIWAIVCVPLGCDVTVMVTTPDPTVPLLVTVNGKTVMPGNCEFAAIALAGTVKLVG